LGARRFKSDIFTILKGSAEVGAFKARFSSPWLDPKRGFPQITVCLNDMLTVSYADDRPFVKVREIQIDVWCKDSPFPLADAVMGAMEGAGYYAEGTRELNEEDINRVCLRYKVIGQ